MSFAPLASSNQRAGAHPSFTTRNLPLPAFTASPSGRTRVDTLYHMGTAVMNAYVFFLVDQSKEQFLLAVSAIQLTTLVCRAVSAVVSDLIVNLTPDGC